MEKSGQNGEDMQETSTWSRGMYFWLFYPLYRNGFCFWVKEFLRHFGMMWVVAKIDFVCWQSLRMLVLWGFLWVPVILLVVSCFYLLLVTVFCSLLCSLIKVIVQLLSCSKKPHLCRLLGFSDLRAPPSQLHHYIYIK